MPRAEMGQTAAAATPHGALALRTVPLVLAAAAARDRENLLIVGTVIKRQRPRDSENFGLFRSLSHNSSVNQKSLQRFKSRYKLLKFFNGDP